ncbi:MAG: hypothetical protein M1825_004795 [Sarcosagium campestre]|nr:MAG: hypothetical protein M1825_004795 [Sarcosagium campestre]
MPGALLTAVDSSSHIHLIVGSNPLAAARCSRSLQVGAKPKLVAPSLPQLQYNLKTRVDNNEIEWLKREFHDDDLKTLGRDEVDGFVDVVFVTLGKANPLSVHISNLCRRLRIPINVTDAPELCTFTLLSTYSDGPLHIGVTTSGRGCKLASRIRREVVASLPADLGSACERLGTARRRIWEEDHAAELAADTEADDEETGQQATFNKLITSETRDAAKNRRIRWLSQICEYWPLGRLAAISDDDVDTILHDYSNSSSSSSSDNVTTSTEKPSSLDHRTLDQRREHHGRIVLAGSGPGHPDLLTTATLKAIQHADVILADKLVPAAVLDLIPRRTPVHIARKFPGNAERAQEELLELGLAGLQRGQMVLRLKQGDPYIYGRGAEEFAFFRTHGYTPTVIPGITSALSAPLFAAIPPTHRAVADQVLICTGTGRKGAAPDPPPYLASRTVVFLMALHRLAPLIDSLLLLPPPVAQPVDDDPAATTPSPQSRSQPDTPHSRWPPDTPCAVIERASCADQRVIRSSLQHVCAAVEDQGSRPPGLLVVGLACRVLWAQGSQPWVVEDGFKGLDVINGFGLDSALNKSLDL